MRKKTFIFLGILYLGMGITGCKKTKNPLSYEKPTGKPTISKNMDNETTKALQPEPTKEITKILQAEPTKTVSKVPTAEPTKTVSKVPTAEPTKAVSKVPTAEPTKAVTKVPTAEPTKAVTRIPTAEPTKAVNKETRISAGDLAEMICGEMGYHTEEPFLLLKKAGYWGDGVVENNEIYYKDLYPVLRKLGEELGLSTDGKEKTAKDYGRISDRKGQSTETVEAAYYLYACGICEGKSDGLYSGTRSFLFEQTVSYEDVTLYLQRLLGKEKRFLLAPEGQLCREENLPEFAEYYPYILADYPNDFYEWEFAWMKNEVAKERDETPHVAPKDMRTNEETTLSVLNGEILKKQGEEYVRLAKEYLRTLFNVNYRTTPNDENWKKKISENAAAVRSRGGLDGIGYFQSQLTQYLEDMKENKTVVECDRVATDTSMFYISQGNWYLRCYVHYRICSADTVSAPGIRRNNVIFSENVSCNFQNVSQGEWRDGYFDLLLGVSSAGLQKPTIEEALVSDYLYETRVHR